MNLLNGQSFLLFILFRYGNLICGTFYSCHFNCHFNHLGTLRISVSELLSPDSILTVPNKLHTTRRSPSVVMCQSFRGPLVLSLDIFKNQCGHTWRPFPINNKSLNSRAHCHVRLSIHISKHTYAAHTYSASKHKSHPANATHRIVLVARQRGHSENTSHRNWIIYLLIFVVRGREWVCVARKISAHRFTNWSSPMHCLSTICPMSNKRWRRLIDKAELRSTLFDLIDEHNSQKKKKSTRGHSFAIVFNGGAKTSSSPCVHSQNIYNVR